MNQELLKLIDETKEDQGTDDRGAIRDLITELLHIAYDKGIATDDLIAGAVEVFIEEQSEFTR